MSKKNSDGKPTKFQTGTLNVLGCNKRVRTYREAENAIKRLRRAKTTASDKPRKIRKIDNLELPNGMLKLDFVRDVIIVISAFAPRNTNSLKAKK